MDKQWNLSGRVKLYKASILNIPLEPNSLDAVFMDTSHIYPDDYEYIKYLTTSGILHRGFLFIGDDPVDAGTDKARQRLIAEEGAKYKIITRPDKNLWWFFER